jgi:hypothetical protein
MHAMSYRQKFVKEVNYKSGSFLYNLARAYFAGKYLLVYVQKMPA